MNSTKKIIFTIGILSVSLAVIALGLYPFQSAHATAPEAQHPQECQECHEQAYGLWENSHHFDKNVSCTVCHKLADVTGEHPDTTKYSVESEEDTCLVCHAEVTGENIAGQLAISQHGQVGLTCVSCHEQHSQTLKLVDGARTVCENCHKNQTKIMLESTHFQAGLSCVNCHMGEDKNHTLIVAVETCDECHTNLHEARRMLDAGLEVTAMAEPAAMVEIANVAVSEENTTPIDAGGVHLPSWTYVLAGILFGGVFMWAILGQEPGESTSDNTRSKESKK